MKLLMAGDIVGNPGRRAFAWHVGRMRGAGAIDTVIVNGENAAGGRGISLALLHEILDAGADAVTLGDHAWDQRDLVAGIEIEERVVRPANFAPGCPGRGWIMIETAWGKLAVVNLVGRVFMPPVDCPFRTVDTILKQTVAARWVVVDFHAEATSEKMAMGRYLDGRVAAVVGTHTHVQTSDETVLPRGTAYMTDLGMTGPRDSIIGRDTATILKRFTCGMPAKFEVASGDPVLEGLVIDLDESTGRALSVRRIREKMPPSGSSAK